MSWVDKINNDLIITTGDGKEYRPQWLNAVKQVSYKVAEFDFPEIEGTLIKRGTRRGTRYAIEIYFQGDNNIDNAKAFEISARDRRPWTISHPLYERLLVHPISLIFDNSKQNVTKITGEVVETITEDYPKVSDNPSEQIKKLKSISDIAIYESFSQDNFDIKAVNQLNTTNNELYNEGKKGIDIDLDFEEYFNAFNNANSAINSKTIKAFEVVRELQAVINKPFTFSQSVQSRIGTFKRQFDLLISSSLSIANRIQKKLFEGNGGALLTATMEGSVTDAEYANRKDVLKASDIITSMYNQYLVVLDSIQSDDNSTVESYIPDSDIQQSINQTYNYTISNLLNIAINAKQERALNLEEDSNPIILTHRFYGMDDLDNNLNRFLELNEIGLNEMLQIRKGRSIKYLV